MFLIITNFMRETCITINGYFSIPFKLHVMRIDEMATHEILMFNE